MELSFRIIRAGLFAMALVSLPPCSALAQDWPLKEPIKVIVPFGAGSSTDAIARLVADQIGKQLGQTLIVENRAGASGTTGTSAVAKASPDGYTLLVHASSHTVTPSTFTQLSYNAQSDFAAVAVLASIPIVIVTNSGRGYKTTRDLIAAAKAKPGAMNYASAGVGSATHLAAERFKLSAGFAAQHVPFKGSSDAITEILADRMDFYASPVNSAISLINEGKLTGLAVSASQRSSALPNVPTTVEAGLADSNYDFWVGALFPAKTPDAIVNRMHAEVMKAMAEPALIAKFAALGADPVKLSPKEFEAMIAREIISNAAVVKAAGIKAN